MTVKYDHAMLKIWFSAGATSRNISNVMEIEHKGNTLIIRNNSNTTYIVNYDNVNMIEEIFEG